ncbi:hypothetical protein [Streptomyces griseocarneus]|uniref:hypothetical protein n=1 Tax=Streptomyces griseocarneus TaxID=51201 RepID=UPI00167E8CAA|nr:hypothetical protein [Streptomyces griseocarneus]MBZ6476735.1 hypothetical protein [Streptomyces griseocarneus]GHG80617.1 hypothetical protein GCM10018779_62340 [Streptomyces griseocarneus]
MNDFTSADTASSAMTWPKREALQRRHSPAQQHELSDPDDFLTDAELDALYAQPCPLCAKTGRWERSGRTVRFTTCGHAFPMPSKPAPLPVASARRPGDCLESYDCRTGTLTLSDGTLPMTLKSMWTQTIEQGEEHWQITTTVGTMSVERAEVEGVVPFALVKAVVAVAGEEPAPPCHHHQVAGQRSTRRHIRARSKENRRS